MAFSSILVLIIPSQALLFYPPNPLLTLILPRHYILSLSYYLPSTTHILHTIFLPPSQWPKVLLQVKHTSLKI